MRFIFSIVKNIIAVLAIIAIIYIALKYALSLEIKNGILYMKVLIIFNKICMILWQITDYLLSQNGKSYSLKENDIINNVPSSQIKMYLI